MDYAFVFLFVAATAYYGYVHFHFWRTFKVEAPDEYRKYAGFSVLKYTGGFHWIDYALRRGYRELNNPRIMRAGDAQCKANVIFTTSYGFALFLFCLGILGWSIWLLIKNII